MTSHLLGALVENYKRIELVDVEFPPEGGAFAIMGRNAAGKSSLIDALESAIAGRKGPKPVEPVRDGEESARVVATFDDIIVTRVYKPGKSPTIKVTNAEGRAFSNSEDILRALYSHVSLDPLAFSRLDDTEQVATLLRLIGVDPAPFDAEHDEAYSERTDVNRDLKALEARLAAQPKERTDLPTEVVSVAELTDELSKALGVAAENDRVKREHVEARAEVDRRRATVEAAQSALDAARSSLSDALAEADRAKVREEVLLAPADVEAIRERIAAAASTNAAIGEQRERARIAHEVAAKRADADVLTARIEKAKADKRAALAAAPMPVPGMTIEDGRLELDGVPFSQASTGVKIRTGTAIAMRLNPTLRLIVIRDASLLDAENREMIDALAKEHGFLVLMELADTSAEVGVLLEEGSVSGVRS